MEIVNNTTPIHFKKGVATVSHVFIAEKSNTDKTSIRKLINKYKTDLERFGELIIEFEVIKAGRGTTRRKIYYLNEYQAYLLLTFLQNTKEVKNFKVWLISEFQRLREYQKIQSQKPTQPKLLPNCEEELEAIIKNSPQYNGLKGQVVRLENELARKQSEIKNLEAKLKNPFELPGVKEYTEVLKEQLQYWKKRHAITQGAKDYIVEKIEKAQKELNDIKAVFEKPIREDKNFIYVGNAILPKNGRF